MSIFSDYYNTPAKLYQYLGMDNRGNALYDTEPIDVACRFDVEMREVLDKNGEKVTSAGKIQTVQVLAPLDRINVFDKDYTVISSAPCTDLFGGLDHWEARV